MVGRKKEITELSNIYNSNKAELVAIYGRRRVGKTYLIDETFSDRITFRHAGLSPVDKQRKGILKAQLEQFYYSLQIYGMEKTKKPETWMEAFFLLEKFLMSIDDGSRQLVFLDELPWLDTPRSGFITAFEGFWNNWACHRKNLMVIVCGSANSWILDKLINNHGGLYNRVTYEIKLSPFTLAECEEFLQNNGVKLSRYNITESYMILGGIPYYLGYFQRGRSLAQNIDNMFFSKNAKLKDEYSRLFRSGFSKPDIMMEIVNYLYTRNAGMTRQEISNELGIKDGGVLSDYLNALIASDFVIKYVPFGLKKNQVYYKLVDPFCMFYLKFVRNKTTLEKAFWQKNISKQSVVSWRGFAFESVCFNHIEQIKMTLGVGGVVSTESAWSKKKDDTEGMQIDLLITRDDNVVNMCEIKFYSDEFVVDGSYYRTLQKREVTLSALISPKMVIHNTLITTYGLCDNEYSGIFTRVVTMDDLFTAR